MVDAHDPLFQENAPAVKTWFCPDYLPWVCLPVTVASGTSDQRQLYVWFQIRAASRRTMLHPDTIRALNVNEGDTIQILGKSLPVRNISNEPYWHQNHNMLGNDGYTNLLIGHSQIEIS
jgi:hypothetical protein